MGLGAAGGHIPHNPLRPARVRPRAVRGVAFPVNSCGIGRPKTPCGLSRSALPPTREGYAGHPQQPPKQLSNASQQKSHDF